MSQQPTSWRNTPYDPERIPLDHFYLPAMPPLGMMRAVGDRWRAWRRRRELRELLRLDDHILRDIGYRRDDIAACSQLPLRVDAAAELVRRTRDTRGEEERRPSCETHRRPAHERGRAAPCPDARRHATASSRDPRRSAPTASTAALAQSATGPALGSQDARALRQRPPPYAGVG